jgi:hypothetical protein
VRDGGGDLEHPAAVDSVVAAAAGRRKRRHYHVVAQVGCRSWLSGWRRATRRRAAVVVGVLGVSVAVGPEAEAGGVDAAVAVAVQAGLASDLEHVSNLLV